MISASGPYGKGGGGMYDGGGMDGHGGWPAGARGVGAWPLANAVGPVWGKGANWCTPSNAYGGKGMW